MNVLDCRFTAAEVAYPKDEDMMQEEAESDVRKNFFDTGEGYPDAEAYELLQAITKTRDFCRLRRISFLGAIDYIFHPNGRPSWSRHNRFYHSIAVGRLACLYGFHAQLEKKDRLELVAAGLLHDIGHMPLSHSAEKVYEKEFGLNHHLLGLGIIEGRGPHGNEVRDVLATFGLSVDGVCALIEARGVSPHKRIFSKPINIDTVEAVYRSKLYISSNNVDPSPDLFVGYFFDNSPSSSMGDRFWADKDDVYTYLINGPTGRLADFVASHFLETREGSLDKRDVALTDVGLRKKFPELFSMFRFIRRRLYGAGLSSFLARSERRMPINRRRFLVNHASEVELPYEGRYLEIKERADVFDAKEVFEHIAAEMRKAND